jgi:hypothetical protein
MKKVLLSFFALGISAVSFAQYCSSGANFTGDSDIENVVLNGVNNSINNATTNCTGYSNFTNLSADLVMTQSYPITVLLTTCSSFEYTKSAEIYIDWNQDFDFNDPGELVQATGPHGGLFNWNTTITVPPTASVGNTRMRIVVEETSSPAFVEPCGSYSWGETEDYTIEVLPPGLFVSLNTPNNPLLCAGDSVEIAANGFFGTPPYDFAWSSGQTATGVLNDTLFGATAGTYTVTITDSIGDDTNAVITLTQPDSIEFDYTIITPLVCDYDESEVQLTGSGGIGWESYAWDTAVANYAWDSCSGQTVSFGSNNSVSAAIDIGFDFTFFGNTYDQFKVASNGFISFDTFVDDGCCDGDPIPNASTFEPNNAIYAVWDYYTAAFGQYSYCLQGVAPNRTLTVSFENMPICCGNTFAATAQITLHEGSNCIDIETDAYAFTFGTQTQGIENAGGDTAVTYPGRNGSLWGTSQDDSYIQFCPADTAGLIYEWSNGYVGNNPTGLSAGTYTVSATDANGCVVTEQVVIDPAPSNFVSALDVENVSCFSFDDATVDPGISGGVAPVTYAWNNGATSATLSNVAPGTYSVSAEDNLGCTIEVNNIVVTEPDILLGSIYGVQGLICEGDDDGIASIAISGGTAPYTPTWTSGEIGMTATNLTAGPNNVEVIDSNGCELFVPVNIPFQFNDPTPELGNNILSAMGASVVLSTAPTTYPSYTWSTGETSTTISVNQTGVYWVEVANANGCTGSDTIYVEIWPTGVEEMNTLTGVSFYPNPARDMINFEINTDIDELNVTITDVKGAIVANATFLNGGNASMDVANLSAGVYTLNMKSDELNATQRLVISK